MTAIKQTIRGDGTDTTFGELSDNEVFTICKDSELVMIKLYDIYDLKFNTISFTNEYNEIMGFMNVDKEMPVVKYDNCEIILN